MTCTLASDINIEVSCNRSRERVLSSCYNGTITVRRVTNWLRLLITKFNAWCVAYSTHLLGIPPIQGRFQYKCKTHA